MWHNDIAIELGRGRGRVPFWPPPLPPPPPPPVWLMSASVFVACFSWAVVVAPPSPKPLEPHILRRNADCGDADAVPTFYFAAHRLMVDY